MNYIQVTPNDYVLFDDIPRGPSTSFVTMKNLTSRRIAFKIRTTSPKGYVVKPNNGIMGPNEQKKIEFVMQPVDDVTSRRNNQDKFMIIATELEDGFDAARFNEVWKERPQDRVQNIKLTAAYKGSNLSKSQQIGNYERNIHDNEFGRNREENVRMSVPMQRASAGMYQSTASPGTFGQKFDNENYDRTENELLDREKLITKLTEERTSFFNELTALRESIERNKLGKGGNYSSYQLWHVLLVAIVSLIVGAFLSAEMI